MSNASVPVVHEVQIVDELGRSKSTFIPGERSLTIYLDKREVVTLMTLGSAPEALVLGYLRNQRLVESADDIESIQVDWETDSAAVKTRRSTVDIDAITSKRVGLDSSVSLNWSSLVERRLEKQHRQLGITPVLAQQASIFVINVCDFVTAERTRLLFENLLRC